MLRACLTSLIPFLIVLSPFCAVLSQSVVCDSAIAWTVARQALLSMAFLKQEYWRGLPFPFPGDLPDSGMEPTCWQTCPALADVSCIGRRILYH